MKPVIVGAGLAGLLAAHAWPNLEVLEVASAPAQLHKAVLRFRTEAVSSLTGIPFRRVTVHKGIWSASKMHTACTIPLANAYAQKVLGRLAGERSVWNLSAVERFIAPESFYADLVEAARTRITWNYNANFADFTCPIISTAPLPVALRHLDVATTTQFDRAPIQVVRLRVPGADVFQTVYFPDADCPLYRASITGSLLTLEATSGVATKEWLPRALVLVQRAFAVKDPETLDSGEQKYGKIAPIPDQERKRLLYELTHAHKIYSLGRFATWRNVLLCDLINDIAVIKRLMRADTKYDLLHAAA